jgi:hypothetical protein
MKTRQLKNRGIGLSIALATSLLIPFITGTGPAFASVWHVDGSVETSGDGTTWQSAFKTIQEGIDAASDSDAVVVAEGTYVENIRLLGKNITLTSTDPLDASVVANTTIDGSQAGSVVTFSGTEDETCALQGFTIPNGRAWRGGGLLGGTWGRRTHAAIEDNRVIGNEVHQWGGAGLAYCDGPIRRNLIANNWDVTESASGGGLHECDGLIEGNTIQGNIALPYYGGGLVRCHGIIEGNIIWANTAMDDGEGRTHLKAATSDANAEVYFDDVCMKRSLEGLISTRAPKGGSDAQADCDAVMPCPAPRGHGCRADSPVRVPRREQ